MESIQRAKTRSEKAQMSNSVGRKRLLRRILPPLSTRLGMRRLFKWATRASVVSLLARSIEAVAQSGDAAIVFGRINLAVERVQVTGATSSHTDRLSNNRSILGFRGSEDLGDGLKAIWQIAGSVAPDTGTGSIASRDSRVGLEGAWGTLFAGAWTLPYSSATSSFDPFYLTTAGYMALLGNGLAFLTDNVSNSSSFDRRQENVAQYWTPAWSGLSARFAYAFNEEVVKATGAKPSLWSASASYARAPWLATAAHEVHRQYQAARGSDSGTKVGVSYETTALRVSALVEHLRYETAEGPLTRDAVFVSAAHKDGRFSYQVAYSKAGGGHGAPSTSVGFVNAGDRTAASQVTLGVEYSLSRRTSLRAFASRIANQADAAYDFAINQAGVGLGQKPLVAALGIRHDF